MLRTYIPQPTTGYGSARTPTPSPTKVPWRAPAPAVRVGGEPGGARHGQDKDGVHANRKRAADAAAAAVDEANAANTTDHHNKKAKKRALFAAMCLLCTAKYTAAPTEHAGTKLVEVSADTYGKYIDMAKERKHLILADKMDNRADNTLHVTCRKQYTRTTYKLPPDAPPAATTAAATPDATPRRRTDHPPGHYKTACFFCSEECNFLHVKRRVCHRVCLQTKPGRTLMTDRIRKVAKQRKDHRCGQDPWGDNVIGHINGVSFFV